MSLVEIKERLPYSEVHQMKVYQDYRKIQYR